jgi:small-conductance mechanosensitive channel
LSRGLGGIFLLVLLLGTNPAHGQPSAWPALPGLSRAAAPSAPASATSAASATVDAAVAEAQDRTRLAVELDTVQRLADQFGGGSGDAAVPPGVAPEEVALAVRKLDQWTSAIEGQTRSLAGSGAARAELAAAQAENSAWVGLAGKPPYSILQFDEWARDAEAHQAKIDALRAAAVVAERELVRQREAARQSGEAQRRAEEAARAAKGPELGAAEWRARAASWAASADGATLAAVTRERQWSLAKAAVEQEQLNLLQRKLNAARGQLSFSAEDLAQVRRVEQTRQARLDKESEKAQKAADQHARDAEAATLALQQLRAVADTPADRLDAAEAQVRALRAATETARREVETLSALNSLSVAGLEMWALRFDAVNAPSADKRREATAALRDLLAGLQVWRAFASGEMSVVQAELTEQAVRQERAGTSAEAQRYDALASEALRQRALRDQELVDSIERIDRALRRWLQEVGSAQQDLPWRDRAAALWGEARALARTVWSFELFAAEETVDVQGQKVTISRGVTVGKSVGAALLFVIGYLLAAGLARYVERTLARRFGVGPAQARTVRRWALALVAFMLLVVTLNLAQIPLTVFAFLGGAMVLGVGFGTQTIIKNFISGLIVLMERQVRVGDVIDVDGMTGRVAEVNLRSSTIKGFDGIDAIVPNSQLLEGRVSNWTMGNHCVRRVVKVGVAYGSPTERVAQCLLECAKRHASVLKEPPAKALFEDFGDNALVFALYVWIDVQAGVDGPTILSELRFMIEKSLAEAGVGMPFPQRDIHVDTLRPLHVELSRRASPSGPKDG